MFKFLKEKLKGAISKFSKKAEEEVKAEKPIEKRGINRRTKNRRSKTRGN